MGPRLLIEASIAILLLTAVLARADTPYGSTTTATPKTVAAPAPQTTPNPTSTTTPATTPTRAPGSIDSSNTYQSGGGGAPFGLQGSSQTKEPVIDGKAIPKTIEFSTGTTDQSTKPNPKATAAPQPKKKGRGKVKRSRVRVDKAGGAEEEDDGLNL